MTSPAAEVLCGEALITPTGPLLGMLTQPATDTATAASTQARRAKDRRRAQDQTRMKGKLWAKDGRWRAGRGAGLVTQDRPGELGVVWAEGQGGTGEFLAGQLGQGQPEHRALAA